MAADICQKPATQARVLEECECVYAPGRPRIEIGGRCWHPGAVHSQPCGSSCLIDGKHDTLTPVQDDVNCL